MIHKKFVYGLGSLVLALPLLGGGLQLFYPGGFQVFWLRTTFGISDAIRDRGLKDLPGITAIDDLAYGEDKQQVLDIYYPQGTKEPLPTIINVHGGGYAYGDKELYRYYCMTLAEQGFTVVNFTYRLAPEFKYPCQVQDVNAAVTFALDHADDYKIRKDAVFMVGDSAGAQLASQYAVMLTSPAYQKIMEIDTPDLTLKGIALNCGVYNPADLGSDQSYYFDQPLSEYGEQLKMLDYIDENYPPSFVMSANKDMCLPYAAPMHELLTERGAVSELHIYGDEHTKLHHVFHCNIRSEAAKKCNQEECAFFKSLL